MRLPSFRHRPTGVTAAAARWHAERAVRGVHARAVAVVLLAASTVGCTHYVKTAETAYGEGRYLEAAEDLAHHEQEVSQLSPARRAQYGVYRGLSLLKLGEIEGASRWLNYTMEVERQAPGSLAPYQRAQLDQGLQMLRRMTSTQPAGAAPAPLKPPPTTVPPDGSGASSSSASGS